jgi:hypothetical protein
MTGNDRGRLVVDLIMVDLMRSTMIDQAPRNDTRRKAAAFAIRNPQEIATSLRSSQ